MICKRVINWGVSPLVIRTMVTYLTRRFNNSHPSWTNNSVIRDCSFCRRFGFSGKLPGNWISGVSPMSGWLWNTWITRYKTYWVNKTTDVMVYTSVKFGLSYWGKTRRLTLLDNISMLRKTFWLIREELVGGRRKLCNEELRDLYSSSNITRMVKPRRMG